MITTELLNSQIAFLQNKADQYLALRRVKIPTNKDKSDARRLTSEIHYKRSILRYLETNPTEESVKKQLELVEKKIQTIDTMMASIRMDNYEAKKAAISEIKRREGYSSLKNQMDTLKFILGDK